MNKPKIFIALGSSGPIKELHNILEAISKLPVIIILATSGRTINNLPSNIYCAELLPYEETIGISTLMISQGGISSIYAALKVGTPLLAIANNADTHLASKVLVNSGAGIKLRSDRISADRVRKATEELLRNPKYKKSAIKWSKVVEKYDSEKIFPQVLNKFLENYPIS